MKFESAGTRFTESKRKSLAKRIAVVRDSVDDVISQVINCRDTMDSKQYSSISTKINKARSSLASAKTIMDKAKVKKFKTVAAEEAALAPGGPYS